MDIRILHYTSSLTFNIWHHMYLNLSSSRFLYIYIADMISHVTDDFIQHETKSSFTVHCRRGRSTNSNPKNIPLFHFPLVKHFFSLLVKWHLWCYISIYTLMFHLQLSRGRSIGLALSDRPNIKKSCLLTLIKIKKHVKLYLSFYNNSIFLCKNIDV